MQQLVTQESMIILHNFCHREWRSALTIFCWLWSLIPCSCVITIAILAALLEQDYDFTPLVAC